MIFMDENVDDKWKWMNFFMNIGKKFFLAKIKQKKQDWKKFMLVYLEKIVTWNVEIIFQLILHISLIPSIFCFAASKPYKISK